VTGGQPSPWHVNGNEKLKEELEIKITRRLSAYCACKKTAELLLVPTTYTYQRNIHRAKL